MPARSWATVWAVVGTLALPALAICGCGGADGAESDAVDPGGMPDAGDVSRPDAFDPGGDRAVHADPAAEGEDGVLAPDVPVEAGVTYIVVADDHLVEAAEAHAAYRAGQGLVTAVFSVSSLVQGEVDAASLVPAVRAVVASARARVAGGTPLFLVLYGDAPGEFEDPAGMIPAAGCENDSLPYAGCATDNAYGDIDDDGVPEAAVGRVPVRTAGEGAAFLAKIQAFESKYETGTWNRRVALYTGEAGFGGEVDAMIEAAVMEGLKRVSHAFDIIGAYDNPNSPYYYTPFEEKVLDIYNEGSLMTIYVGHGSDESMQGLSEEQIDAIHCAHRLPFALFFACHTGDYTEEDDSISELLFAKADGPIAVFASTDVSHPYGNAVLAYEAQRAFLDARPRTVGEALLATKVQSIENADDFRKFVDAAAQAGGVSPWEQQRLRRQHLDLYNLLGDPATPMQYPASEVVFDPIQGELPDGTLTVSGATPGVDAGSALVTLETERDVILASLDPVDPEDPDPVVVAANWARAVDKTVVSVTVPVTGGRFQAVLVPPEDLPVGTYYIKVYAEGNGVDSFGFVLGN